MVSHMLYFSMNYSTLLEPLVCASGKLLLTGDLNFHVNNPSEGNAYQFLDVLSCFNLNALNFNILIHKSNNLSDLIDSIWRKHRFSFISQRPGYLETLCCPILDFERPSNKKVVLTWRKLSKSWVLSTSRRYKNKWLTFRSVITNPVKSTRLWEIRVRMFTNLVES